MWQEDGIFILYAGFQSVNIVTPRYTDNVKVCGGHGDGRHPPQAGQVLSLGVLEVETVEEGGEEDEELLLGELVAEAHPLADAERDELLGLDNGRPVVVEEPLGPEGLGLLPVLGVHMDGVQQRDHMGVLRNSVSFKFNRSEKNNAKKQR